VSEAPAPDSDPKAEWLDSEATERIRSLVLGLSADLVAHVCRSTGASLDEEEPKTFGAPPPPSAPPPQ